eukprot:COSAG06_NODE_77640_length_114_cov_86.533333_1_plen_23_part_01
MTLRAHASTGWLLPTAGFLTVAS